MDRVMLPLDLAMSVVGWNSPLVGQRWLSVGNSWTPR